MNRLRSQWTLIWIFGLACTSPMGVHAQTTAVSLRDVVQATQIDTPNLDANDGVPPPLSDQARVQGLSQMMALTLQNSPQILQARAALQTAHARMGMARADLLPTFSYRVAQGPEHSVSTTLTTGYDNHRYHSKSTRLTQPLFNMPQYKEYMSAVEGLDAAELRMKSAQENVALSSAQTTVDLCISRVLIQYAQEQQTQLELILNFLQQRVAAGASSQADFERARTRVLNAQQTRIDQQTIYRNALLDITRLTGQKPELVALPEMADFAPLPARQEEIRALVKDSNFDILALRKDIESQHSSYTGELSKYLPVVGISVERDTTQNVHGTNDPWTDTRALGVLSWNFSLAGKELYSAQMAAAELRNRESKLEDQERITQQATEADLALLQAAQLRIQAAISEEAAARAVVKAVDAQLKSGRISSLLEALDASERHYAARQRLLSAIGQQMKTHAQLLMRLGLLSATADNTTGQ